MPAETMCRSRRVAAAFTAVWLGVESMVYPDLHGSLGTVRGALAALWGVLLVVAVELARRRESATNGSSLRDPGAYRRAAT